MAIFPSTDARAEQVTAHLVSEAPPWHNLCRAVTKRLRSVSNPAAILGQGKFADGKVFTYPTWQSADLATNIDVVRNYYKNAWDLTNKKTDEEREAAWEKIKPELIAEAKAGDSHFERADLKIMISARPYQAVVYRYQRKDEIIPSYVVHSIEENPGPPPGGIRLAPADIVDNNIFVTDGEFVIYKGIALFMGIVRPGVEYVNDDISGFNLDSMSRELAVPRICNIRFTASH